MTCIQDRQRLRDCIDGAMLLVQARSEASPFGYRLAGIGVEAEMCLVAVALTEDLLSDNVPVTEAGIEAWLFDQLCVMFEAGAEFARRNYYPEISPDCSC